MTATSPRTAPLERAASRGRLDAEIDDLTRRLATAPGPFTKLWTEQQLRRRMEAMRKTAS